LQMPGYDMLGLCLWGSCRERQKQALQERKPKRSV